MGPPNLCPDDNGLSRPCFNLGCFHTLLNLSLLDPDTTTRPQTSNLKPQTSHIGSKIPINKSQSSHERNPVNELHGRAATRLGR